jgi:1-acyl-sn-glycerol-3-phosphate acyltransferase
MIHKYTLPDYNRRAMRIEVMSRTPGPVFLFLLRFFVGIASLYFRLYHHWRVQGRERIPVKGPLIIIVNHLSAMDVPAVGVVMVEQGIRPGIDAFTVSKAEAWEKPLLPHLLWRLGMFPLQREMADMHAMRNVLTVLRAGRILGIAPEGTRSATGQLQLFQPTVAKIAVSRRVPLLPVGVWGTREAMPIGKKFPRPAQININIGTVFELSEFYGRELTEELQEDAAWEMRRHLAGLLPEWMRELPPSDAELRFGAVRKRAEAARARGEEGEIVTVPAGGNGQ